MNPTGKIFAAAVLAAVSRVGRERSDDVARSHADSWDLSCVDESIDAAFKASACCRFLLGPCAPRPCALESKTEGVNVLQAPPG